MTSFAALFFMQGKRLLSRKETRIALTAVLIITTAGFIETCLHFVGFEVRALPSAAYGWAWNMDALQIQSMRVFAYFLIFIVAASVFADNLLLDSKSGVVACIASRCSAPSYVVTNALLSFLGGFFIVLLPLVLSQLLALLVFPLEGTFAGHYNTPVFVYEGDSDLLFPDLYYNHPYSNNLVFALYASLWAGLMALLSCALSLVIKKHRLIILGIPTVIVLLSSFVVPAVFDRALVHFYYLYPNAALGGLSPLYFALAPHVILALSVALIVWALRIKKDVLL
jgi:hypothetical protein